MKTFLLKITSRKFMILTAFFVMAQIFKGQGKIGDIPWIIASAIGAFGYPALKMYFGWKEKKLGVE